MNLEPSPFIPVLRSQFLDPSSSIHRPIQFTSMGLCLDMSGHFSDCPCITTRLALFHFQSQVDELPARKITFGISVVSRVGNATRICYRKRVMASPFGMQGGTGQGLRGERPKGGRSAGQSRWSCFRSDVAVCLRSQVSNRVNKPGIHCLSFLYFKKQTQRKCRYFNEAEFPP